MSELVEARRRLEDELARLDEALRREVGHRPRALAWRVGLLAAAVGIFLAAKRRSTRRRGRRRRG